jgi:Tfp pilus assembly protein PilX
MISAKTLRALLRPRDERGNILLITLVAVAVITLLGIAVYDLAQIEAQNAQISLIDYRAYEVAQTGIERGIRELRDAWNVKGATFEAWTSPDPTCTPGPCSDTQYKPWIVLNNTVATQTTAAPYAGTDPGGTYNLEVKLVSVAEANNPIAAVGTAYPFGQMCITDSSIIFAGLCRNLIFLRSTGTVTDGLGNTRSRTIQTLVKASSSSPWAGGIVAEQGNPAVSGEALIAGSIHVLGDGTSNPAVFISGGAGAGMRNNWFDLDATSLDRLAPRQLICPAGANCAGGANLVESLGAEIKIYGNTSNTMFQVSGGSDLGKAATTAAYGVPPRNGKGALDFVNIAGGCLLPCTGGGANPFALAGGSTVTVDRNNITKPYLYRPPRGPIANVNTGGGLPNAQIINDTFSIGGTDYPDYFTGWFRPHTTPGINCVGCSAALWSVGQNLVNATPNCALPAACNDGASLVALLTPLHQNQTAFRHTFSFKDKAGVVQVAEMCWKRETIGGGVGNTGVNLPLVTNTLEFGMPNCAVPSTPANPVMFEFFAPLRIDRNGGAATINYRGAAIIVTGANPMIIDEAFQSYCPNDTASGTNPPCYGTGAGGGANEPNRFPDNHLFAVMNTNGIDLAPNNPNVGRIMGYFFSEGNITVRRNVNVVGMLRAVNICFRNSAGCGGVGGGGTIPGFFQASFADTRAIPPELPAPYEVLGTVSGARWLFGSVPQFFMECRLPIGQGIANLPLTPTGICGYQ